MGFASSPPRLERNEVKPRDPKRKNHVLELEKEGKRLCHISADVNCSIRRHTMCAKKINWAGGGEEAERRQYKRPHTHSLHRPHLPGDGAASGPRPAHPIHQALFFPAPLFATPLTFPGSEESRLPRRVNPRPSVRYGPEPARASPQS